MTRQTGNSSRPRWRTSLFEEGHEAAVEERLRRFARQLVRRHRADIERVAAALDEQGTLTADTIDAMLPPGFMARPATWALALAGHEAQP